MVSTPLKNISQLGWLFPVYGKIKHVPHISKPPTSNLWWDRGKVIIIQLLSVPVTCCPTIFGQRSVLCNSRKAFMAEFASGGEWRFVNPASGENHLKLMIGIQWEIPLFLWPFSMSMLNYRRVCHTISKLCLVPHFCGPSTGESSNFPLLMNPITMPKRKWLGNRTGGNKQVCPKMGFAIQWFQTFFHQLHWGPGSFSNTR